VAFLRGESRLQAAAEPAIALVGVWDPRRAPLRLTFLSEVALGISEHMGYNVD